MGMRVGEAMDLTTGWDFSTEADKQRARDNIAKYKPKLIIGSPMCTMFSQLQRLSTWTEEKQRRWREDRRHLKFMAEIYKNQIREGRWFLLEHPAGASSWSLAEIQELLEELEVDITIADQCMYGLRTWGMNGVKAKKSTKFMSNSLHILQELSRR